VLGNSFRDLDKNPGKWNEHIAQFFDLEIERLIDNANHLFEIVENIGNQREKKKIDRSV
jgi:hypothetical protein